MSGPVNTEASEPEGSVDAETIDLSQATSGVDGMIVNSSLWRAIWHLSWPLYLNMMTIALASFSEIWVGGRLGSAAQAAIGLGGQIWFFLVLLVVALSAGTMHWSVDSGGRATLKTPSLLRANRSSFP